MILACSQSYELLPCTTWFYSQISLTYHLPSLTICQPHGPHCCSNNTSNSFMTLRLCIWYYFSWEFCMSVSIIQVSSQNLILRESLLIRVGWYPCQIPQSLRNSQNRRRRIVICKEPHTLLPHHTLFISAEIPSPHFCSLHLSTVLSRSLWPQPPPNPNKKKPEQQQKKPNKITYNNYNLLF